MKTNKTDNEIIAEFMGAINCDIGLWYFDLPEGLRKYFITNNLSYHTSWDWLMPVVEKIGEHVYEEFTDNNGFKDVIVKDRAYPRTFGMMTSEGKYMFRFNRQILFEADTLIQATYEACVDFIKWYNSNPPTK